MKKEHRNLVIGFLLGLLAAWLFGLLIPSTPPAPEPAAPAQPVASTPVAKDTPPTAVILPTTPPVKVSQPAPGQPAAPGADQVVIDGKLMTLHDAGVYISMQMINSPQGQQQARTKAVLNNLRQISSAAQQFMMEKGVTQAGYYDLVGTGTDNYLRNVSPVMGEDYSGIIIQQNTTEVSIVAPDGTTVTFDQ